MLCAGCMYIERKTFCVARSWALVRFSYSDGRHKYACACVQNYGVTMWKEVGADGGLTVLFCCVFCIGIYRCCDAVCEAESDITSEFS